MPVLYDEWESRPPNLYNEWEQKPPIIEEQRDLPPSVDDVTIEQVEDNPIDIDLTEFTDGTPEVTMIPTYGTENNPLVRQDGTRILGTMPEGDEEFFRIRIRTDT